MGTIGGTCQPVAGTGLIEVMSVADGQAGAVAGLQAGDFILGVDGQNFSATSTDTNMGYLGAIQELGHAIDRAEGGGGGGVLRLEILRSGVGGVTLDVDLGATGSFGPAWPMGSAKADAMYEWSCQEIHTLVMNSSSDNFGYLSGFMGIILLSHPDWAETTGARPYRLSIDQLRVRCEAMVNGEIYEPLEAVHHDGTGMVDTPGYASSGLNNWDFTTSAMFLALYRSKTADATVDATLQRTAEALGYRVQHWQQYDDADAPDVLGGRVGRMGHGGVSGDYSRRGSIGALNIINAHALPAFALLRNAGADMSVNLGLSANAFGYNAGLAEPTIEQKVRYCWEIMKAGTRDGGDDDGNVGYVGQQSGWDSSGRTAGSAAGWKLYGLTPDGTDESVVDRQVDYFIRHWHRQQHTHAYTVGGVVLSQMALPFVSDLDRRFFQQNTRFYAALARQADDSVVYIPGRQNNGGDSYLNFYRVGLVNMAMPRAIRSGNLPGFPAPAADVLLSELVNLPHTYPSRDARRIVLETTGAHALDVLVTDRDGIEQTSGVTASWQSISGPSPIQFSAADQIDTTATFSTDGDYRAQLTLQKDSYTLVETYDFAVDSSPTTEGVAPFIMSQPEPTTIPMGEAAALSVVAQGDAPLLYQWRLDGENIGSASSEPTLQISSVSGGHQGDYDCVITNAHGSAISQVAALVVSGAGEFLPGGLWRDVFSSIDGSSVSTLTSADSYPRFPDSGGVVTLAEAPAEYGSDYGQRISGWITPPESGDYRFYLAADDQAELWLSTTDQRADRVRIASRTGYNSYRAWSTATTSPSISLVAGQRYYIEILHKENGGGDHVSVTWDWLSAGVFGTPSNGSAPLPGALLQYQVGGTFDDTASPPQNYAPTSGDQTILIHGGQATAVEIAASDFEGDALSYQVVAAPQQGTVSGVGPSYTYTPGASAEGVDTFTIRIGDGVNTTDAVVTVVLVAQDVSIWSGDTDTSWSASDNWVGGALPAADRAVLFTPSSDENLSTQIPTATSIHSLVVSAPGGPVDIGGQTLTLSGGINMLAATESVSISAPVVLGAAQSWQVGEGVELSVSSAVTGNDALTKSGVGSLTLGAVSSRSGEIVVDQGSLILNGGGWYQGYVGGSGPITVNAGATLVNQTSHAFGSSNNASRDLYLYGGTFQVVSSTYIDDLTLRAGRVEQGFGGSGNLRSRSGGSEVIVEAADASSVLAADYNAVGSVVFDVADGSAAIDLLVEALTGSGAATKRGPGSMRVSGQATHTGSFDLEAGTLLVDGTLSSATVALQAGTILQGAGDLAGAVDSSASIEPGGSTTAILSMGQLQLQGGGRVVAQLGGTGVGAGYDRLTVDGTATLAGTLQVELADGFVPSAGDAFRVVAAGSRSGEFDSVSLPTIPSDLRWQVSYDVGGIAGVSLEVEPLYNYERWSEALLSSVATGLRGRTADADGDGISNYEEYVHGLDPVNGYPDLNSDPYSGLPTIEIEGGDAAVYYRKRNDVDHLSYTVEQSATLEGPAWTSAGASETSVSTAGDIELIKATVPATPPKLFFRVSVSEGP